MKYLKHFETGYYTYDSFHEASKKLRIIFHTLGIEMSELKSSIHFDLDLFKIPYSIFYLLLLNNENIQESYPIFRRDDGALVWNNTKLDIIMGKEEKVSISDNGVPLTYAIIYSEKYAEIISQVIKIMCDYFKKVELIGTLTSFHDLGIIEQTSDSNKFKGKIQDNIIEFINNPNHISDFLLELIYNNITRNTKHLEIINIISKRQPLIYKELIRVYPDFNTSSKLGEIGF